SEGKRYAAARTPEGVEWTTTDYDGFTLRTQPMSPGDRLNFVRAVRERVRPKPAPSPDGQPQFVWRSLLDESWDWLQETVEAKIVRSDKASLLEQAAFLSEALDDRFAASFHAFVEYAHSSNAETEKKMIDAMRAANHWTGQISDWTQEHEAELKIE